MIKLSKEQIESIEKVAAESAEHRAALIAYGAQRHIAGMLYGAALSGFAITLGAFIGSILPWHIHVGTSK